MDEIYVLGINGETEAVFSSNGVVKFFNVLAGSEIISRFIPAPPVDLYFQPKADEPLAQTNTTLTGTYEAQNSITVESNVTVSGTATLKAGNSIHLKPGFTASSGNNFTAKIGTVTNTAKRFYYLKDHLGSARVVVNETGEIVSYDDYDPWGMILTGRSGNFGFANDKYKFTGKERDVETGYDYFGARYYDSRIARWLQVDPLYEKHPDYSPYNYVLNNPLILIDPDGRQIKYNLIFTPPAFTKEQRDFQLSKFDFAARILAEPYDWVRIGIDYLRGEATYWDALALAPFLSGGLTKGARETYTMLSRSVSKIKATEEIGSEAAKIFQKIDNTIADHLEVSDITGAMGDLAGKPIIKGGKTWQHLDEVQKAQSGLVTQIEKLQQMLGNKNLSNEARRQIEQKLGATSKLLDETEKYVPR